MTRRLAPVLLVALILPALLGHEDGEGGCCDDDDPPPQIELGPPTGATCPPSPTLTYDNFGKGFMTKFCTRCHASTLSGEARQGAPAFHDFDTLEGIKPVADHIDEMAGIGPKASNTKMPPGGDLPTEEERRKLAEWIACGTP